MRKTFVIICLFCGLHVAAQEPLSRQMAATVMSKWKSNFSTDGTPAKWSYDMGVMLKGFEGIWLNTGDVTYFKYIQDQMDDYVQEDGIIKTYKLEEFNIDNINNGKLLLLLYRVTQKEKYLKAAKILRLQLASHPKTTEGSFWHKKIYPYQVWLDGLYMGMPFYAEYARISGEDSAFDNITRQFSLIEQHTRDSATGLLYHGWDQSKGMAWANPVTGCSPLFWGRAMGWYASAIVDALDFYPAGHPGIKTLTDILERLTNALEKQQDKKTGLWYDILNYDGAGREKNYFEASASSQFVYAIAKGVRKGYLPASKINIAKKGYAGIQKNFLTYSNGQLNLQGTVKVSGLGGKPFRDGSFDYYMSEPVIENDPKGIGAFLMASNEMEMLPSTAAARGKTVLLDNYFNSETRQDAWGNKRIVHYKWDEKENGGFSFLGHIFNKNGFVTKQLREGPTADNLKDAAVYLIVDPDWPKENKAPNYIEAGHIEAITNYVKAGGVLVMMGNDSNNVEFAHFNNLAEKFGIHWNENMVHDVINNQYEQGLFPIPDHHPIFKTAKQVFIKQLCTQQLSKPATSVYTENGDVLMSVSKLGKGTVYAIGDPWFYNEYVDGRKIPAMYENYKAAEDLVKWLARQAKKKK